MRGVIRVWQELDLKDVEDNLIVVGELSSECFSCHTIGVSSTAQTCPKCNIRFKYIGFRRKVNFSYIAKIKDQSPGIALVDFDDFKKSLGKRDARKLLDI